jgi:hypothetical protein
VEGGAELACSHVTTAGRLLQELLARIGRDVMSPVPVSPIEGQKLYLTFSDPLWVP